MKTVKKIIYCILFISCISSCGPSFCDCVWYQTNDTEACEKLFESHFGTKYPSEMRLEAARKGSCKEKGEEVDKRLKDAGY